MRIFEHGRPMKFGLVVSRLNDIGVKYDKIGNLTIGTSDAVGLWRFSRIHNDIIIAVAWASRESNDLMPVAEQRFLAERLYLTTRETNQVFGWMIL